MTHSLVSYSHIAPKVPVSYQIWMQLVTSLDDRSEMAEIEKIVSRDPGLVVKIMAVANSVYFGQGEGVNTLEESLMRLGSMEVVRLAAMLAFQDTTSEGLPLYGLTQKDFTTHSVNTAMLMAGLAKQANLTPGEAYTLGLVRGLGHWFIQQALRSQNISVRPYEGPLIEANTWEEDVLQINHAEFAANTLRQFRMPSPLLNTLSFYLRPHRATNVAGATLLLSCTEQAVRDVLPARRLQNASLPQDWYLAYAAETEFQDLCAKGHRLLSSL